MCAPSVRLRRTRCCHMHMSHAMLALGQIEAMPSQREGQGFESPYLHQLNIALTRAFLLLAGE
jgi:hypothetical protein